LFETELVGLIFQRNNSCILADRLKVFLTRSIKREGKTVLKLELPSVGAWPLRGSLLLLVLPSSCQEPAAAVNWIYRALFGARKCSSDILMEQNRL
jgi:hypothetical protein